MKKTVAPLLRVPADEDLALPKVHTVLKKETDMVRCQIP